MNRIKIINITLKPKNNNKVQVENYLELSLKYIIIIIIRMVDKKLILIVLILNGIYRILILNTLNHHVILMY